MHTGGLVGEIRVVAQRHAHRGIDDLGDHAVAVLIGDPVFGVIAAAMELLEGAALGALAQLLALRPAAATRPRGMALSMPGIT